MELPFGWLFFASVTVKGGFCSTILLFSAFFFYSLLTADVF
jgi:hypothetical protein